MLIYDRRMRPCSTLVKYLSLDTTFCNIIDHKPSFLFKEALSIPDIFHLHTDIFFTRLLKKSNKLKNKNGIAVLFFNKYIFCTHLAF